MSEERRHRHFVDEDEDGMRIDMLLGELDAFPSRSAAVKAIDAGEVTLDGKTVPKKTIVSEGSVIEYPLIAEKVIELIPQNIPLDIRYEDEYLIVLSKQVGLVCHPSAGHEDGTLANALLAHCGPEHLGTLQGDDRPGIVHRLDRDTTGLMLAAKSDEVQAALQDQIRLRTVDRRYLALVHGIIAPDTGLIDAPIARGTRDRMRMEISEAPNARSSVTTITVLERFEATNNDEGYTLIECKLYTGRTHQIRVHMEYIQHPCVGDPLYGNARPKASLGLTRQFLHSYSLSLEHPMTGEPLGFLDSLPWDLEAALDELEGRSMGRTEKGEEVLQALSRL